MDINTFKIPVQEVEKALDVFDKQPLDIKNVAMEFLHAYKGFIDPNPSPERTKGFLEGVAAFSAIAYVNFQSPQGMLVALATPDVFFSKCGYTVMACLALRMRESKNPSIEQIEDELDKGLNDMLKALENKLKGEGGNPPI